MTIALIDGDVAAYIACKSRYKNLSQVEGFDLYAFDGKKPEYSQEEDAEYLMDSWVHFTELIHSLLEVTFATDYLMAVKDDTNFRDIIYPEYKAHRHKPDGLRNLIVPAIRSRAVDEGMAIRATFREADDMLRIWAEQCRLAGERYVICSIDKDLRCIPGAHYHMKENTFSEVSEEEALRLFYQQLLSGDPTDNVPGLPSIGPKKAVKLLAGCTKEEEFKREVIDCYKLVYEDDWRNYLLSNGKMLYLQKYPEDWWSVSEWLQELNLTP
jgi:5'-3' exonuclease